MQKEEIRKGFNFLAPWYDVMSTVLSFNAIHRSQKWLVKQSPKGLNVLIIGGGTGRPLMEMLQHNVAVKYCYVDISDKMIESAKQKLNKRFPDKIDSVQFIRGSYTDIPTENFDLIVTPCFLDCFAEDELTIVMNTLHNHLAPNGTWLFADFNIPSPKLPGLLSGVVIRLLCIFFNMVCKLGVKGLPDFSERFSNLGYKKACEKYFFAGLLVGRVYFRYPNI
ncbi:MAG TPA: class I SAM-dependent methyltransferase [Bacteroidia bacterium]|nr:class I SAM-dependent methyltransferase [Bacteroidia bacterium]